MNWKHRNYQVEQGGSQQWFWVTHELAQFSVLNKLRTSFGKAQETLAAIEDTIRKYSDSTKYRSSSNKYLGMVFLFILIASISLKVIVIYLGNVIVLFLNFDKRLQGHIVSWVFVKR